MIDRDRLASLSIPRRQSPAAASRRQGFAWSRRWLWLALPIFGLAYYVVSENRPISVTVAAVALAYPAQTVTLLNATGYAVPQTKADVASKATGRLEKLEVEEGSSVRRNEIIARLENQDLRASLNQAAANVRVARTDLDKARAELQEADFALRRAERLVQKNFVSRELYDAAVARQAKAAAGVASATAAIEAAEAARRAAEVAVEYTLIRAPFDGVIIKKHADVGDVVAPFASTTQSKGAVVSMADLGTLQVEADVSESNLSRVIPDQPCEIQLDAVPDTRFWGRVHRIMPTVDKSKATVVVKVRFDHIDPRILPDMSAKVAFLSRDLTEAERQPVIAVPRSALIRRDGADRALVLHGPRVRLTPVETGGSLGELAVVRAGLALGDQVVTNPPPDLPDGATVRVAQ